MIWEVKRLFVMQTKRLVEKKVPNVQSAFNRAQNTLEIKSFTEILKTEKQTTRA